MATPRRTSRSGSDLLKGLSGEMKVLTCTVAGVDVSGFVLSVPAVGVSIGEASTITSLRAVGRRALWTFWYACTRTRSF